MLKLTKTITQPQITAKICANKKYLLASNGKILYGDTAHRRLASADLNCILS